MGRLRIMAGTLAINTLQIGDSATASQNFHLKTNVDGSLSLNRGNDGASLGTVLNIDALGNVQLPVLDNTGVATDRVLPVGGTAVINATSLTTIPLRIATATDQIYQILMFGTYVANTGAVNTYLQINNTNYTPGQFTVRQIASSQNTAEAAVTAETIVSGFRLEAVGASVYTSDAIVCTKTTAKRCNVKSSSTTSTRSSVATIGLEWSDTTTPWTSLGTIILPNAWTGQVVIKRIL